jgi:hypothetical protein
VKGVLELILKGQLSECYASYMPYYHDKEKRMVAFAPDEPDVFLTKGRKGGAGTWSVSVRIQITRADNYTDPRTGRWAFNVMELPHDEYDESRDTKEKAITWFKMNHYPNMPEVSRDEYEKHRGLYQAMAEKTGSSGKLVQNG